MITFTIDLYPCSNETLEQYLDSDTPCRSEIFSYLKDDLGLVRYSITENSPSPGCRQSVHIHRIELLKDDASWKFTEEWFPGGKRGAIQAVLNAVQNKYFKFDTAAQGDRFGLFISCRNDAYCFTALKEKAENLNGTTWSMTSYNDSEFPVRRDFAYHLEYGNAAECGYSLALYIDCTGCVSETDHWEPESNPDCIIIPKSETGLAANILDVVNAETPEFGLMQYARIQDNRDDKPNYRHDFLVFFEGRGQIPFLEDSMNLTTEEVDAIGRYLQTNRERLLTMAAVRHAVVERREDEGSPMHEQ